jgi:hypothetical protein
VCFSESPTFALDFFRYRSYSRWQQDQRFGIGFDKSKLTSEGVRPVVYGDDELVRAINTLYFHSKTNQRICIEPSANAQLMVIIENIYPLLFPLLENEPRQGFMWEREWRYPYKNGFIFNHSDIKIICCPENEESKIRELLGRLSEGIEFIRAWRQYTDVTQYLKRQKPIWQERQEQIQRTESPDQDTSKIKDLIRQYKVAISSLDGYNEFIDKLSGEVFRIEQEKGKLKSEMDILQDKLDEIEREKKNKLELEKRKK